MTALALAAAVPDPRPTPLDQPSPAAVAPGPPPLPFIDALSATLVTDADEGAVHTAVLLFRGACELARGRRTPAQLDRWTSERAREALAEWAQRQSPAAAWELASVHAQQPADDVVEACARLVDAGRSVALALRLERRGPADRWRATAADGGPVPGRRRARVQPRLA